MIAGTIKSHNWFKYKRAGAERHVTVNQQQRSWCAADERGGRPSGTEHSTPVLKKNYTSFDFCKVGVKNNNVMISCCQKLLTKTSTFARILLFNTCFQRYNGSYSPDGCEGTSPLATIGDCCHCQSVASQGRHKQGFRPPPRTQS